MNYDLAQSKLEKLDRLLHNKEDTCNRWKRSYASFTDKYKKGYFTNNQRLEYNYSERITGLRDNSLIYDKLNNYFSERVFNNKKNFDIFKSAYLNTSKEEKTNDTNSDIDIEEIADSIVKLNKENNLNKEKLIKANSNIKNFNEKNNLNHNDNNLNLNDNDIFVDELINNIVESNFSNENESKEEIENEKKNENNKENIPNLKNEDSKIDQNMGNNVESPRKAFLNEVIEEESKLSLSPEKQMIVPCNFNSLLSDKTGEDIKKECSTNLINKSKENLNNSSNIVLSESKSNKNESINSSFKEKASEVVNEGLKKIKQREYTNLRNKRNQSH